MSKKINPRNLTNKVDRIAQKYGLLLKYMALGPTALTKKELKMLIDNGLLDAKFFKPTIKDLYIESHIHNLRQPSRRSVREMAIKHLNSRAGQFIDKWTQKAASDLKAIVQSNVLVHNQQMKQTTQTELAEGVIENRSSKEMARRLREKTRDLAKDWNRVVTTELAEAQNLGALDAIIENNKNKPQSEVYVYKTGPHDSKTCKYCMQFWFAGDGVTPKVYKLSELMANGSNMGRKAKDWVPTVGNTHPNERHYLMELPLGWGFRGGGLSFIGKDHNEYEKQKD